MRGGAVPVLAVGGVEGPEVELLDRLDHKPGEVVFRQPVAQVRGQEQRLVSVSCEEVLWHARMVQNRPDSRGVCATASARSRSAASHRCFPWRLSRKWSDPSGLAAPRN